MSELRDSSDSSDGSDDYRLRDVGDTESEAASKSDYARLASRQKA